MTMVLHTEAMIEEKEREEEYMLLTVASGCPPSIIEVRTYLSTCPV
jgi:hypothetical protein